MNSKDDFVENVHLVANYDGDSFDDGVLPAEIEDLCKKYDFGPLTKEDIYDMISENYDGYMHSIDKGMQRLGTSLSDSGLDW